MSLYRVRYRERAPLTAADLNAEGDYRAALQRRHNIGLHRWGILFGLRLQSIGGELILTPGAAVDGYGRELAVPDPLLIPESLFAAAYPDGSGYRRLDFWLRYARFPQDLPQTGIYPCGPGRAPRRREEAGLCATRAEDEQGYPLPVDPRRPPGVPRGDVSFPPQRDPPQDLELPWPVYLGRVAWPPGGEPAVDHEVRRAYAGLVGDLVRSPARALVKEDPKKPNPDPPPPVERAHLDLSGSRPGHPAFAIRVAQPSGVLADRVRIARSGRIDLTGRTTVASDLTPEELGAAEASNEAALGRPGSLTGDALAAAEALATAGLAHVHDLCIGRSDFSFSPGDIPDAGCLADRLASGRLPLLAEAQERVRLALDDLAAKNLPGQFRAGLADLLNELVRGFSKPGEPAPRVVDLDRLWGARLSQETWRLIDNWPAGEVDFRPLNWRVLAETLAGELAPGLSASAGRTVTVGDLGAVPEAALPWQVYHTQQTNAAGVPFGKLHFEIPDPGDKDDPRAYQLAIGQASGVGPGDPFRACLTVDADCNVTIRGQLRVAGRVLRSPVPADPDDPRYTDQLVQGWLKGEQAALIAATTLQAHLTGIEISADRLEWTFDLDITNQGLTAVTAILVHETYTIAGQLSPTRQAAQVASLEPEETTNVSVPHTVTTPLPGSGSLGLVVSVQGRGPGGQQVYAKDTLVFPLTDVS